MVEIGGREARFPSRQKPPRAVIETFARNVHVVGVEDAVDEARHHVTRREIGHAFDHQMHQTHGRLVAVGGVFGGRRAGELRQAIVDQLNHMIALLQGQQALEGADADMSVAEPRQHGGAGWRGLVAAFELLAGFDHRKGLRRVHAERFEHFGRQDLAHRAFQRQPSIAAPAPRRGARSLGAEIHQAPGFVPHLSEQKAAPVADLGIVDPELMPVIAQRERLGEIAGHGIEPPEMAYPVGIAQFRQPDRSRRAVIAPAQRGFGKVCGLHRIADPVGQRGDRGVGTIGGGLHRVVHPAIVGVRPIRHKTARRNRRADRSV